MVNVGLVVEGPHDLIMLEPIIEHEFRQRHNENVIFHNIQPTRDATGSYSGGGWTRVMGWCLSNSGANLQTFFQPLFEGDSKLDVIIIHLDGDALDLVRPHVAGALPGLNATVDERVGGLELAVEEWLQPGQPERTHLVMAFPTMQTESWILAAENHPNAGETANSKQIFQMGRPTKKLANMYRSRVQASAHSFGSIGNICRSYVHFERSVANVQW